MEAPKGVKEGVFFHRLRSLPLKQNKKDMGFRLNPIFITNQASTSDEELLTKVGLKNLKKGKAVDFYDTNKKWDTVFVGSKGACKILCNGNISFGSFGADSTLLLFNDCEVAAIIWNETVDSYGFCLIKNGEIIRKIMVIDGDIEHDYGQPIEEESSIKDDELFGPDKMEKIIEMVGEEGFERMAKSERICRATNSIVKRYLGVGLVEIKERIELNEYEE